MNCLAPSNHLKTEDRDSFPRKGVKMKKEEESIKLSKPHINQLSICRGLIKEEWKKNWQQNLSRQMIKYVICDKQKEQGE